MTINEMRNIDIRTVDPATLTDRKNVHIERSLPKDQRISSYLQQISNPYCYLDNGIVVKVSFTKGGPAIDQCLENCIHSHYINA